ncbi:MAG: hypothetical protein LBV15_05100, partial [Planctomycetota bacterium]|nr:hypothetical protein [Planctomycetota bacterium]
MPMGRPLLCFAAAAIAGATLARLFPDLAEWLFTGWLAAAAFAVWFVLTPDTGQTEAAPALPEGYARHILPLPGFFAQRGLNRFLALSCLIFLLAGAERQTAWRQEAETELRRLSDKEWLS